MAQRRCFRFAYNTPVRGGRQKYPFQMRDGDASMLIMMALALLGFEYAGPIFNFASRGPGLIPVDLSFLTASDLIFMTTRPPMHDYVVGDKKGFSRSFTTLEELIFQSLGTWFARCARSEIVLTDAAAAVSPAIANRQSMVFRQNGGAGYQEYFSLASRKGKRFRGSNPLTAAFLTYTEHAWPSGPALLAAFGPGGVETLAWCHRLATQLPHLLCTTPFAMAEIERSPLPEHPESMAFAESWGVTILGAA